MAIGLPPVTSAVGTPHSSIFFVKRGPFGGIFEMALLCYLFGDKGGSGIYVVLEKPFRWAQITLVSTAFAVVRTRVNVAEYGMTRSPYSFIFLSIRKV
jgi:hypothetical protein